MILKAIKYFALSLLAALPSVPALAATYYLSPTGNNGNSGTSEGLPWKTFAKAFSTMAGGDELILLDGTYSVSAGTGYISYLGTNSAQPPSGSSTSVMTYIHAKNPGSVNVTGALFLGRSTGKNSYIKIQGITFDGGSSGESTLYNTSYIYIKDCGFYGTGQDGGSVFGIGTNDGNWGNTYNLIEDVWIWGKNRIIASNYRANNNIWRRVFVRGDGCNTGDCTGSGNPNVGITVYNSKDVSLQNVIVVDRILGGGSPYADFATAQHDPGPGSLGAGEYLGPNEWLGTISLKSPDVGYYFEADDANNNTGTLRNVVAWISADDGINIGADYRGILLENITAGSNGGSNIRVAPAVTTGTVRNIIAYNASLWGVNSAITPSYVDVYGAGSSNYNQTSCSVGCKTTNPIADGTPASLKYITRIETGSALKGTGYGGGDYGANIVNRYGADGTFYGQSNYNALTANALWPWPNEARIKSDLCATSNRGFCLDSSLTHYILNTLGNGDPYSGGTTYTVTPSAGANGSISPNTAQTVNSGSTATFTVTPNSGYTASASGCGGTLSGTTYTTGAITANCAVSATFSDTTAPSVSISNTDPSTISSDSLNVYGTASDAVVVTGCKWRIGSAPNASNGTACTGTTSFGCATSGYSIGSNTLHVGCYDAAGNYGTDSITVSYPCKKLAIPSGLSFVGLVANPPSNATLSFDWSDVTTHAEGSALTGDLANYRTYFGTVSGGPYNTASSASSQISVGPTNANVTYYARVAAESSVNSICNSDQTAEISLFADTVPPVLSGLNPSGNYPKTAANVALGVTTNEAAACRYGSAGSAWASKTALSTTGSTSHSDTLAVWAGLVKRICYQCRDALLNESAESCTTFSVSAKPKVGVFN